MSETIESHGKTMNKKMRKDIDEALLEFPCLKLIDEDTGPNFHLEGRAVLKGDLDRYFLTPSKAEDMDEFMKILVIIQPDYRMKGCVISDEEHRIDWDKLPYQHRHCNTISKAELLCTHLPEEVPQMKNPILENINTAYVLFNEYQRYLRTGKFELKEYSHGKQGLKEFRECQNHRRGKQVHS